MVCFPDLFNLVLHCLQQQKHAGSLSWRNGALPEDEVWVKIGGNNGGSSFKLSFQIANTTNPNAICNTIPFLVFGAPDSVENLTMTLKPYCAQVKQLEKSMLEGKLIRCIFFGDYELICSCFGLSGSSGRRPCLFCLVTKKDMQYAPAQQPTCETWSLDTLVASL